MNTLQLSIPVAVLESLIEAAVLAPSGDNVQPWRFEFDAESGRIAVCVDEARDCSPMNAGQRMSRIAVGAAVQNILRTAAGNCWDARCEPSPDGSQVLIRFSNVNGDVLKPDEAIQRRVTNRRQYDGRRVPTEVIRDLASETPVLEAAETYWIVAPEQIDRFADLIARADEILFGSLAMRKAFLANVRFDADDEAAVEQGLSLASLELQGAERAAFRMLPRIPNWLFKLARIGRTIGRNSANLVRSASGLCLVVAADDAPRTDFVVGRAMQQAWLALTARQFAVQPMTSLLVLENAMQHGLPELQQSLRDVGVSILVADLNELVAEIGVGRPAFLMRFGFAATPSGRTGRLPVETVLKRN
jgi:nitroreductase